MLRDLLKASLKSKLNGATDVAILYSGGFESFTCLCICKDLGITPHLYTFYLQGVKSYDIQKARNDAKVFGCELTEVELPNDYNVLRRDVFDIVEKLGGETRKTIVQCMHPIYYTIPKIKEKYVIIGLERGRPWGLNKKGSMAARVSKQAFDEYRLFAIEEQNHNSIKYICEEINKSHVCVRPYDDDDVDAWFMSKTYFELNTPHAKQPIIDEFGKEIEISGMNLRHSSYQVESGIRDFHNLLLKDKSLNPNGKYVNVVGVYNNIKKSKYGVQLQLEF